MEARSHEEMGATVPDSAMDKVKVRFEKCCMCHGKTPKKDSPLGWVRKGFCFNCKGMGWIKAYV